MTPLKAVAISGSPRSPSKSRALAEAMLHVLSRAGCGVQLIDVAELPAEALLARAQSPQIGDAIAAVGAAQILVAATPTYRALYTGALKCFFDLMPQAHLAGKLCLPLQTGIAPQHFLAIEYGLRPLFMSLDGIPLAGVYATDSEFVGGAPSPELTSRLDLAAAMAVRLARVG